MPDWLFEGRASIYVVLVALSVFLLLVWWQTRKRGFLIAGAFAAGLIGLYAILDAAVETDREQIVRKIKVMIAAVNAGDLDGAFEHISDDFRSQQRKGKEELRELAKRYVGQRLLERIEVWDIACIGEPSRESGTARAAFMVKLHGSAVEGFLAECDATFDFDARHGWRLKGVRLLKPQTTEEWSWQF